MSAILWLISLPLRIFGYAALLGAILTGAWDAWRSFDQGRLVLTPLGEFWYEISADSLNLVQAGIQRGLSPLLWDPGLVYLLRLPGFVALLILAALALLIAQLIYRPRP